MRAADLLHSIVPMVLIAVAPGIALATALVPRWPWWERLAVAPGLSAGFVGVLGLLMHYARVPFEAATVVPLEVPVVAVGMLRWRRSSGQVSRSTTTDDARSGDDHAVVAASLLAGIAGAVAVIAAFSDQPLPIRSDAAVHGTVAAGIASQHDAVVTFDEPVDHTTWSRPRPAFEASAALVSELAGPAPANAMLPLAVLAVLLLPLGLAALVLEVTGSRVIAALAPLLGVGTLVPGAYISAGDFPLVLDLTLVAPLLLGIVRGLRAWDVREHAALSGALVASVWIIHGSEVISAIAVGGTLVLTVLMTRPSGWVRRALLVGAGCAAGALLVTLLTHNPTGPTPVASSLAGPYVHEVTADSDPSATLGGFFDIFDAWAFPDHLFTVLYIVGAIVAIATRRLRWALVSSVLLIAAAADVMVGHHLDELLWRHTFPWSNGDRLVSLQYWLGTPLMALGLSWLVVEGYERVTRREKPGGARLRVLAPGAAGAGAVALTMLYLGAHHQYAAYRFAINNDAMVTDADVTAMKEVATALPAGAVVLTDGLDDGGQWIGALTPATPFFEAHYLHEHQHDLRVAALAAACSGAPLPAGAWDGIDAVYIGARHRVNALYVWDAKCIEHLPSLTPLVTVEGADGSQAVVFQVAHPTATRVIPGTERNGR